MLAKIVYCNRCSILAALLRIPSSAHLSEMLVSTLEVAGVATAEHDCWAT